mmetsp:Transcript_38203/g.115539  ORF Transcript_38203/g.115539 Transcript_38203/m.115539 type:complete len:350 (-) Transcript_38203:133-1182(-)
MRISASRHSTCIPARFRPIMHGFCVSQETRRRPPWAARQKKAVTTHMPRALTTHAPPGICPCDVCLPAIARTEETHHVLHDLRTVELLHQLVPRPWIHNDLRSGLAPTGHFRPDALVGRHAELVKLGEVVLACQNAHWQGWGRACVRVRRLDSLERAHRGRPKAHGTVKAAIRVLDVLLNLCLVAVEPLPACGLAIVPHSGQDLGFKFVERQLRWDRRDAVLAMHAIQSRQQDLERRKHEVWNACRRRTQDEACDAGAAGPRAQAKLRDHCAERLAEEEEGHVWPRCLLHTQHLRQIGHHARHRALRACSDTPEAQRTFDFGGLAMAAGVVRQHDEVLLHQARRKLGVA